MTKRSCCLSCLHGTAMELMSARCAWSALLNGMCCGPSKRHSNGSSRRHSGLTTRSSSVLLAHGSRSKAERGERSVWAAGVGFAGLEVDADDLLNGSEFIRI